MKLLLKLLFASFINLFLLRLILFLAPFLIIHYSEFASHFKLEPLHPLWILVLCLKFNKIIFDDVFTENGLGFTGEY